MGLVMESDSQPQDHDSSVSAISLSSSLSQPISESQSPWPEQFPDHWTLFTQSFLCSANCHTKVCHKSGYNRYLVTLI